MKEILLINPSKKRAKKGKSTMAKKKRAKKNPSVKSAISRARSTFLGLNFDRVIKDMPSIQLGMFAAKWAAKRFGDLHATETDPESWGWESYLKGALGAVAAGALAQNVKRGSGQKVLEGGLNLMAYKMVQNELVPRSSWASGQLGEGYAPGEVVENEAGEPYLLGDDGEWYPVDERHRLPEQNLQADLEPPGRLGDVLEPPGRLGDDPYARAFHGTGR